MRSCSPPVVTPKTVNLPSTPTVSETPTPVDSNDEIFFPRAY